MTNLKKFTSEPEQKGKFPKLTLVIILSLLILGVLEIWVSHSLANNGEQFEKIEKLQTNLIRENILLENKIAQLNSLSKIASKSAELGLIEAKDIQFISEGKK